MQQSRNDEATGNSTRLRALRSLGIEAPIRRDLPKDNEIDYGPTFDFVGSNEGPGVESGARGETPTVYFNDPNKHLIEIRTY